jgi:hypothetical protein
MRWFLVDEYLIHIKLHVSTDTRSSTGYSNCTIHIPVQFEQPEEDCISVETRSLV